MSTGLKEIFGNNAGNGRGPTKKGIGLWESVVVREDAIHCCNIQYPDRLSVDCFVEIAVWWDTFLDFQSCPEVVLGAVVAEVLVFGNVRWNFRIGRSGSLSLRGMRCQGGDCPGRFGWTCGRRAGYGRLI
jgi:hypothetical protein